MLKHDVCRLPESLSIFVPASCASTSLLFLCSISSSKTSTPIAMSAAQKQMRKANCDHSVMILAQDIYLFQKQWKARSASLMKWM